MTRLRSNASVDVAPSQTNRSTRSPRSGTARSTSDPRRARGGRRTPSESAGRDPSWEPGPCSSRKGRRSRWPRNLDGARSQESRSEKLLTARSSAVPWTSPLTTRRTWPVCFSITSHSVSERKARPMGVVRPLAAVRTERLGTVIEGRGLRIETSDAREKDERRHRDEDMDPAGRDLRCRRLCTGFH